MDLNLTETELLEVGFDVLEADGTELPTGLDDRVLAGALTSPRPSMHLAWQTGELTSLGALTRTAAELASLLDTLEPADWARQTDVEGASVHDLVVHLVGVERYMLGQLGRRPSADAPRREDHYRVTCGLAADGVAADSTRLARMWWLEVMALIAAIGELGPDHHVAYHHLAGGARGLASVRTFELWTHDDDIRRATGRPLNPLDDERLALMSSSLLAVLAGGMALMGTMQAGRTARITVTGAGTQTYDIPLAIGETAGAPDLTITVDALDLCRLASNRFPVGDIPAVVEGDRSLLEPVLVGATAFAMD